MRPTTLTALSLTLLMLLLVLLASFFFVFQGQLALRDELVESNDTIDTLEADRARLEIDQSELQATATMLHAAHATAVFEGVELSQQLAETDLQVTQAAQEIVTVEAERDIASATLAWYEATGPLVTIIEPQRFSRAVAGDEMIIVVVASDVVDVTTVTISIDNELLELSPVTPGQQVTVRQPWTPPEAGQAIITVTAVNSNNVTSQPDAVTVSIIEPTALPTSTVTATATLTPEPSPTP
jgi:hypothetical protein